MRVCYLLWIFLAETLGMLPVDTQMLLLLKYYLALIQWDFHGYYLVSHD